METKETEEIYNTEGFNTYLISSLTSQEKQKESEWMCCFCKRIIQHVLCGSLPYFEFRPG